MRLSSLRRNRKFRHFNQCLRRMMTIGLNSQARNRFHNLIFGKKKLTTNVNEWQWTLTDVSESIWHCCRAFYFRGKWKPTATQNIQNNPVWNLSSALVVDPTTTRQDNTRRRKNGQNNKISLKFTHLPDQTNGFNEKFYENSFNAMSLHDELIHRMQVECCQDWMGRGRELELFRCNSMWKFNQRKQCFSHQQQHLNVSPFKQAKNWWKFCVGCHCWSDL